MGVRSTTLPVLLGALALALFFIFQNAMAQTLQPLGSDSDNNLPLTFSPEHPSPNQTVNAYLQSYATDLNRSIVSWYVNNTLVAQGVGQKNITFKTGRLGEPTSILVTVQTLDGSILQKSVTLHPASVSIVAEAESYTPPFYKGKALYSYQGSVRIVAVPEMVDESGAMINPKNLVYNWHVNDSNAPNGSGYGKQVFVFTGAIPLRPTTISVDVSSLDNTYTAAGSFVIAPSQPSVILYEDNPVEGILYNKALAGNIFLPSKDIQVAAVPFFMTALGRDDVNLKYEWSMNNLPLSAYNGKTDLAFRAPADASGSATIGAQVSNLKKIFQLSSGSFVLSFGANSGTAGGF